MSVDILGTNCDQCLSMVQCCFTSTETVRKEWRLDRGYHLPPLDLAWTTERCIHIMIYTHAGFSSILPFVRESASNRWDESEMIDFDLGFLRSWRKALPRCFDTSSSRTEFTEMRARDTHKSERARTEAHTSNFKAGRGGVNSSICMTMSAHTTTRQC